MYTLTIPWKMNIWNPKSWRFGSDDFPFQKRGAFLGEPALNCPEFFQLPRSKALGFLSTA